MKATSTFAVLLCSVAFAQQPKESDFYPITEIPIPEGVVLECGTLELLPDKVIAAGSRRGDLYTIKHAFGTPADRAAFTLYARGLHEPLGLSWHEGWLYVTQRSDVSRLKDSDGDGRADVFEVVSDGWGINGDYHEYAFGSRHDPDEAIWVVLCLTGSGSSKSDYRGWCMRVYPDGRIVPTASGIRSPGGIGLNHLGEAFYCDNQGPWNGTSSLKHLRPGSFQGNPSGNVSYELTDAIGSRPADPKTDSRIHNERERIPVYVPPPILLPHGKMGQSPAGIACDTTGGNFGPFENQLFIAEQTYSEVQRVYLEKVNGIYQGAAFPFLKGFGSGNVSMLMTPGGSLFVGGTDRGWGARGGKRFALERVDWSGKVPFEILTMSARSDGFVIKFTMPVDAKTAKDPSSYEMEAYTYLYRKQYGSPVVDQSKLEITKVVTSSDGRSARLHVSGLARGHIHELRAKGVRSKKGQPLLHPVAYYTLNEIPSRDTAR